MLAEAEGGEPESSFDVAERMAWKALVSTADIYRTGTLTDGHLVSSLSKKLQWFETLTTLGAVKEEARLRREDLKQKIRTRMDALASIMSDSQDVPPGYSDQVIDVPPFSPMFKGHVAEALDELPKRDATL